MKAAYLSNIYKSSEFSHFEISQILNDIKTERYKHALANLPDSATEAYKQRKRNLPAWALNGVFKSSVENNDFLESNGLFHIDIDGLENIESAKRSLIDRIPEIYALWKSPSAHGLKGLIRIPDDFIHNDADFKKAFIQISSYIAQLGITIDRQCKDVRRLCFICSDPDIYINEHAPAFIFDMKTWNAVEKPKPVNQIKPYETTSETSNKYIDRACNVILSAQKGDFHNARLRAGKLAGGMITSGLVNESEIIRALEMASEQIHNAYSDSEATRSIERKAILDGIESGRMQPVEPDRKKREPTPLDFSDMPDLPPIDYYSNVIDFETAQPFTEKPNESGESNGETGETNSETKEKSPFKFVSVNDLLTKEYKPNWLVKGLFEHNTMGLLFGNSASGKSLLVQDLAWCLANGLDFKGKKTDGVSRVAYICGEGFYGLMKRFRALKYYYGGNADNLIVSEQPAAFMDLSSASAVSDAIAEWGGCDLIVIDTFHRNMGAGDENSSKDFAQFLSNIDMFLKPFGATILIIHHSGHDAKERSRGSSSIRASMDFEYMMHKDEDLNITEFKNTKMKDFEKPDPLSFRFNPIDIELIDEDGEPIMGVVLESTDDKVPKSKKRSLDNTSQSVLTALFESIKTHGISCPKEVKYYFNKSPENAPLRVVHIDDFRPFAYPFFDVEPQSRRTVLTRVLKKLEDHNKCMFYNGYLWTC